MRAGRCAATLGVIVVMGLTGCASNRNAPATTSVSGSSVITVVAAENFWGDIAAQIGGSHVAVTSIVRDPNADPHTYESDPHDAAAVGSARLVIENGFGYDDFITKLLAASASRTRTVVSVQHVLPVGGENPNPHVWYDTAALPLVASAIESALANDDPADAAEFAANTTAFDASLQPLLSTIAAIKSRYAGTKVAYTERVPGYLVEAAGLVLGTPASFSQAIEDGNDPTPRDNAAFNAAITGRKVAVLLYNSQVTDAETAKLKALAEKSGVPVVGVSETLPSTDANFQAWQLRQDQALLRALGGTS
jgi:zinc/manganese transport system substrate-binding protein